MKSRFIRFEAALDIDDDLIFPGGRELAEFAQQRDLDIGEVGADDVRDHDLGIDVKLHETAEIRLGRGCLIGMESFVLPGVTVGEGAIVGAGSLVTKDIPAWTIATGRPAAVVRHIPEKP